MGENGRVNWKRKKDQAMGSREIVPSQGRQKAQRKGKMNGWMGEDTDGGSDGA